VNNVIFLGNCVTATLTDQNTFTLIRPKQSKIGNIFVLFFKHDFMKKYLVSFVVMIFLFTGYSQSANAQRSYVKDRPRATVVVRTEAPSRNHIWVSDEWNYRDGRYENVPRHWEVPPANRRHWVAGKWRNERGRGNYWNSGHWN
jgi:hypothetical protein